MLEDGSSIVDGLVLDASIHALHLVLICEGSSHGSGMQTL